MAQGTSVGKLFWSTGVDFSGFKRDTKQAQGAMSGLFNPAILGTAALGAGLIKLGSDALQFSKQFETAFSEVQTISQSARENADQMSDAIIKMTTEIPIGAVDATKALYQIVSAGFDGAEAMSVLEISAKAAVAGVTTTAIAADTLTTIINAYGLDAQEAANISDALFKTVELGKTTLSEIGSSFSNVASLAAAYGVKVNEALAATAAMTKQGAPTAQAMTAIRAAIISITEKMGENVFQTHSFGEALQLARNEADKSGKGLKDYFGRVEAINGVLMLTNENAKVYASSLDQINTSAGSADKALNIMNDTLESQETLLANNFTLLKKQFGDVLSDLEKTILPGLNNELKTLADDTIPGYAKALSVAANSLNIGMLFGGKAFTAEQFSPEIVKSILKAERATEDFTKKTKSLSNEAFQNEVNNIKAQRDSNLKAFEDLEDRKKKGQKFDADALEEAKDRNLIFYQILESAELRLAGIKAKNGTDPKDPKDPKVVVAGVSISSIKKNIKDLQDELVKASKEDALAINIKLKLKENELANFVKEIQTATETGILAPELKLTKQQKGVTLSTKQTKELKKQNKELAKLNKKWVEQAKSKQTDLSTSEKVLEGLKESVGVLDEMGRVASSIDGEMGAILMTVSDVANGVANVFEGIKTENIVQAASGALSIVGALVNGDDKEISLLDDSISKFVESINLASKALKSLGKTNASAEIGSIDDQLKRVQSSILFLTSTRSGGGIVDWFESWADVMNNATFSVSELDDAIVKLSNEILSGDLTESQIEQNNILIDSYLQLKDQLNSITEQVTGTTGESLAGSLSMIWGDGEDAVKQWGDTVDDVIQNVIVNQLKSQLLVKPIQDAIDKLTRDAADGGLSVEEATDFTNTVNNLQGEYADAFSLLDDTFKEAGINLGDSAESATNGIAGAIGRAITEDTATEWIGIQNRVLFETISHTDILTESNGYLSEIAVNTRETADELKTLNEKITSDSNDRDTGNIL